MYPVCKTNAAWLIKRQCISYANAHLFLLSNGLQTVPLMDDWTR